MSTYYGPAIPQTLMYSTPLPHSTWTPMPSWAPMPHRSNDILEGTMKASVFCKRLGPLMKLRVIGLYVKAKGIDFTSELHDWYLGDWTVLQQDLTDGRVGFIHCPPEMVSAIKEMLR